MSMNFNTKHEGETVVYTTCLCNCGGNSQCVIKAHVKDGKVIRVEPDDRYNTNVGREDESLSEQDLIKTRLQRRPWDRPLACHQYHYHPDRILYPLKRAPDTRRGEGKYVRISWDEALTTITDKMKEVREKYGNLSQLEGMPKDSITKPAVVFKPADPKKQVIPWDSERALELWQRRHPDKGESLPDIFVGESDITQVPEGTVGRGKLVLKAENTEELMYYTTDDE